MADSPRYPDSTGDTSDIGLRPDREATTSIPRWVRVFGIIALIVILLFVVVMLTGVGGQHGPGRHLPPSGGTQQSVQQP